MWHQIKSYLSFLIKSTNSHGIHSPYVYDLCTKCLYDSNKYKEYEILNTHRKKLYRDQEIIEITEFGAGSRIFRSNKRKVSDIAKNIGISSKRQKMLFRIVRYFKSEHILELGTSLGLSTIAMALANHKAQIKTVEGCPNTSKKVQYLFDEFHLKNIELYSESFEDFLQSNTSENYNLVYIDGNHSRKYALQYFEILLKQINKDSILIFDDIYWSQSMTAAWQQIISHPEVSVSIDCFYLGMIFFRKEQQKQHFTIRL